MVLHRKTLPYGQTVDLDASIRSIALDLIDDLDGRRLEVLETPAKAQRFTPEEFRTFLERVVTWDSAAWFAHRERYLGTYGPMPFLPPNRLQDLVFQATLGNFDGRPFGRAKPSDHYIRSLSEFEEHVQTVLKLVGRRICQFPNIFLAGGDVLHLPPKDLLGYFEIIDQHIRQANERDATVDAWDDSRLSLKTNVFLDDPRSPLTDRETWKKLIETGLRGVTIAVESGDPSIRATYGKEWSNDDLRQWINQIHERGQELGLVVLIGAGGSSLADAHLDSTIDLLKSLPLGRDDLISLVDARQLDQSPRSDESSLTDDQVKSQFASIKSQIQNGRDSSRPKVIAYNPDKQPT
jgi:hypothetical protein